jgi:hypothetical protein
MLTGLAIAAVTVPACMYGVHRLERWSARGEAVAAVRRDAAAPFEAHPGADEGFAVQLRSWLDAGQGSAAAR